MADLVRLTFTIEKQLFERMERLLEKTRYENRSEFIRDLIRARLVEQEWAEDEEALGTITLVYNHDMRDLSHKLTAAQHHHHDAVLATTHVHLDHHNCAEMIMVKASARLIEDLAEAMRKEKGVYHVSVSISSTGRKLV